MPSLGTRDIGDHRRHGIRDQQPRKLPSSRTERISMDIF